MKLQACKIQTELCEARAPLEFSYWILFGAWMLGLENRPLPSPAVREVSAALRTYDGRGNETDWILAWRNVIRGTAASRRKRTGETQKCGSFKFQAPKSKSAREIGAP
jgi:hypothetical protein